MKWVNTLIEALEQLVPLVASIAITYVIYLALKG